MNVTTERFTPGQAATLAVLLLIPGLLALLTIALHEMFGIGGLYDRVLVPMDHSLPGKALTGVMILLCPAGGVWLGLRGLSRPGSSWRAVSLVAVAGGAALLTIFLSHMVLDR